MLKSNEKGIIRIADDVIAVIAKKIALDSDGIVQMATSTVSKLSRKVSGRSQKEGVVVHIDADEIQISLKVIVEYGVQINSICQQLQRRVKEEIEDMTGLIVNKVDIRVEAITHHTSTHKEKSMSLAPLSHYDVEQSQFIG